MSCSKPTLYSEDSSKRKWYHAAALWIGFFALLAGYGALMGLVIYFVNGGFER